MQNRSEVSNPTLPGRWLFIFAAVGLVALFGLGGYGFVQQSTYEEMAGARNADYSARAAENVSQSCFAMSASEKIKCTKREASEYYLKIRDNQREQDNLAAQQTSALWTNLMGLAALIGMALSAVGVALVWTTFMETKRTNLIAMRENARNTRRAVDAGRETKTALAIADRNAKATADHVDVSRETAARHLRAYLGVQKIEAIDQPGLSFFAIRVFIANNGQTPAKIQSVSVGYYLGSFPNNDPRQNGPPMERFIHFPRVLNPHVNAPILILGLSDAEYSNFKNANDDHALYFYGRLDYFDVFEKLHWMEFCHRITWDTRNLVDDGSICPTGNDSD